MSLIKLVSGKQPELHAGSIRHEKVALSLFLNNDFFLGSPTYIAMVGNTIIHFYKRENQDTGGLLQSQNYNPLSTACYQLNQVAF